MDNVRYFTAQEIANRWGVGYPTVLSLLRDGRLQGFRAGREWRVTDTALREYEDRPAVPRRKQKITRIT